jgi:hypothetical protein
LFKERAIYSWCKTIGVSISFSRNFAKLKKSASGVALARFNSIRTVPRAVA